MKIINTDKEQGTGQEQFSPRAFRELTAQWFSLPVLFYDHRSHALQYDPARLGQELGYPASGPSFDFLAMIHTDDTPGLRALLTGDTDSAILRLRHCDGSWQHFRLENKGHRVAGDQRVTTLLLEPAPDGAVPEVLSRIRSLSEKILAYGTYEYDMACNTGRWSEGLYRLFGYDEERPEITYDFYRSHVEAGPSGQKAAEDATAATDAGEYSKECSIVTRQGLKKQVQVTGWKMYDEKSRVVKDMGFIRDLTRQRLQETVIRKYIGELERSNRELEEFAYIASHDLQEPLRKISTFSSRLMSRANGQLDAESNEFIDRINVSVENMRLLIDSLLEFSRIARTHEVFLPVDLNVIMRQTRQDLELKVEETGTRIVARKLPVVDASATQMKQLFSNLIGNSIKFRKSGISPVIRVSAERLSDAEKEEHHLPPERVYHKIIFADNGIGFEQEYAARIFQVFQRLHGKAEYPGSGIGLSICKRIVDHHGGLISALNIPGQGARFEVILPERAVPPDDTVPDPASSYEPDYMAKP